MKKRVRERRKREEERERKEKEGGRLTMSKRFVLWWKPFCADYTQHSCALLGTGPMLGIKQ